MPVSLLRLFSFLGAFYLQALLFAGSPYGGQIRASLISANKVALNVAVFRNCQGTGFASSDFTYGCYVGNNGSNACGSKTFTVPALKSKDITYLYKGQTAPCTPNSMGKAGFEMIYFNDTIDLNTSGINTLLAGGCNELTFYINAIRHSAYTNGGATTNLYLVSTVNIANLKRCKNKTNQAPQFLFNPQLRQNDDEVLSFTPAPVDTFENDKITCALKAPMTGTNTYVSLKSPYTAYTPAPATCVPAGNGFCSANTATNPPKGFYFDTITARMLFATNYANISLSNSVSSSVLQVDEYRQDTSGAWVKIGSMIREFELSSAAAGGSNNPPFIPNIPEQELIAGKSYYKEIAITDNLRTGLQSIADTVQVAPVSGCKGLKMYVKNPKDREKVVVISGTPDSTYVSKVPYRMSILASDQFKSPAAIASSQILLRIKSQGQYIAKVEKGNCNRLKVSVSITKGQSGNESYYWRIIDSATKKQWFVSTLKNDSSSTLPAGKKYISLVISGGDYGFVPFYDSVVTVSVPTFELKGQTSVCAGVALNIKASPLNMKQIKQVKYSVGSTYSYTDTLNQFDRLASDTNYQLTALATDIWGCVASVSVSISIWKLPAPKAFTVSACQFAADKDLKALASLKTKETIVFSNFEGLVRAGQFLQASKVLNWEFMGNPMVVKTVKYTLTDSHGCVRNDSFQVKFFRLPQIQMQSTSVCQNMLVHNLDLQVQTPGAAVLSKMQYQWKLYNMPASAVGSKVLYAQGDTVQRYLRFGSTLDTKFGGVYHLGLYLLDPQTGCQNQDTLKISVVNEPVISFTGSSSYCAGDGNVDLFKQVRIDGDTVKTGICKLVSYNNSTMNTVLYSTTLIQNRFMPNHSADGLWEFSFTGPMSGCRDTAIRAMRIDPAPDAVYSLNTDTLLDVLTPKVVAINNSSIKDNLALNYEWDPGTGKPTDKATTNDFTFNYPGAEARYKLRLIATSQLGCRDTFERFISIRKNVGLKELSQLGWYFTENNRVEGLLNARKVHIQWYSLAGQLVAVDQSNQGVTLANATYIYDITCEVNGKFIHITGLHRINP